MDVPQIVLVTGCSTGIGLTTAILLAKNGDRKYKVYATVKDLARKDTLEKEAGSLLDSTIFIKELDVTSNEQISSVVDEIIKAETKIDILSMHTDILRIHSENKINNAGIGMLGPLELQSMEKIRQMFSINVHGPINLTKKLMKSWKEQKSGHLIMISSVGGVVGVPFNSTYCASKFAIEGFAESLAIEYKNFGLKVSIIEPGPVVSNFVEKVIANSPDLSEDGNTDQLTKEMMDTFTEKGRSRYATMGQTPAEIASYVLEAIESPQPMLRYHTNKLYSIAIEHKLNEAPYGSPLERL